MKNANGSPVTRSLDTMTIASAIEACRRRLQGVSDVPWLEARILASHVTGLDASAVVAYGDSVIGRDRVERLVALADRRAAGEPVAYIVGYKEFCGLRIAVDRRVLVPRPETEELVGAVVADWRGKTAEILDLGTGSGAVACALAEQLPHASILATDLSADALEVAQRNVERLALGERITLSRGDLFAAVPAGRTFDAIVANLPYVGLRDGAALAEEVRRHEPSDALFAGHDGLDAYRRMFAQASSFMRRGGAIYCECGPLNGSELAKIAARQLLNASIETRTDTACLVRIVVVRTAGR